MTDRLAQLAGVTALAAADRLQSAVDDAAGLSLLEASALVHLQAWPGTSIIGLAGVTSLSQPAAVRLADRLSDAGFLARRPGPDRRTLSLKLTAAGQRAADAALAARAAALEPLLSGLTEKEHRALEGLLQRVVAGLAHDRPAALHVCRLCDRDVCLAEPGCPLDHTTDPDGPRPSRSTTRR